MGVALVTGASQPWRWQRRCNQFGSSRFQGIRQRVATSFSARSAGEYEMAQRSNRRSRNLQTGKVFPGCLTK